MYVDKHDINRFAINLYSFVYAVAVYTDYALIVANKRYTVSVLDINTKLVK